MRVAGLQGKGVRADGAEKNADFRRLIIKLMFERFHTGTPNKRADTRMEIS